MSLPKMHWLPKDQWEAPRAVTGVDELSGKAPLSGLFSGEALAAMIVHGSLGVLFGSKAHPHLPLIFPLLRVHPHICRLLAEPLPVARQCWRRPVIPAGVRVSGMLSAASSPGRRGRAS